MPQATTSGATTPAAELLTGPLTAARAAAARVPHLGSHISTTVMLASELATAADDWAIALAHSGIRDPAVHPAHTLHAPGEEDTGTRDVQDGQWEMSNAQLAAVAAAAERGPVAGRLSPELGPEAPACWHQRCHR